LTGFLPPENPTQHTVLIPSSLEKAISSSPKSQKWAVECYYVANGGATIAAALREGKAIAVSDGSYKDKYGSAALVIEGEDSTNRILAANIVPGDPDDQSSYRSELSGIFGVVTLVNLICAVFEITSGQVTAGCDGIEALKSSFLAGKDYKADFSKADYDMVSAIRSALATSPVTWKCRHVKGHQDDAGVTELDRWATLNVEMDNFAKAYWAEKAPEGLSRNISLEGEYWPLQIQGNKVSGKADSTIYEYIHGGEMFRRWERKGRMTEDFSRKVNWVACKQAMKNLKIGRRHWVAKHVSGHCGVGVCMKKWKKQDTDECPRCSKQEDARHVWTCQSPEARLL